MKNQRLAAEKARMKAEVALVRWTYMSRVGPLKVLDDDDPLTRWGTVNYMRDKESLTFREIGERLGTTPQQARTLFLKAKAVMDDAKKLGLTR